MEYFNSKYECVSKMRAEEYDFKSMNKNFLKLICEKTGSYSTPNLNSSLNLGNKGFRKIEELEEYYNLTTLYLHSNALQKIENISFLKNLRCLFLQNNLIKKIEGLNNLIYLDTLDLSNNDIRVIENLDNNKNLTKLILSKNILKDYEDIKNLENYSNIMTVDLSSNLIDHDEKILDIFKNMENLRTIYLNNNKIKNKISNYRKFMIANIKNLTYWDTRPVKYEEKRLALAFFKGGKEEENLERINIRKEKEVKHKSYIKEIDIQRKEAKERALVNLSNRIDHIEEKKEKIKEEINETDTKINDLIEIKEKNKEVEKIEDIEDDIKIQENLKKNLEGKIDAYDEYIEEINDYKINYDDKDYDYNKFKINNKNIEENEDYKQNYYEKAFIPEYNDDIKLKKEKEKILNKKVFKWDKLQNEELEILLEDNFFDFEKVSNILKFKFKDYITEENEFEIENLKEIWKIFEEKKYDLNDINKNYYEELD